MCCRCRCLSRLHVYFSHTHNQFNSIQSISVLIFPRLLLVFFGFVWFLTHTHRQTAKGAFQIECMAVHYHKRDDLMRNSMPLWINCVAVNKIMTKAHGFISMRWFVSAPTIIDAVPKSSSYTPYLSSMANIIDVNWSYNSVSSFWWRNDRRK